MCKILAAVLASPHHAISRATGFLTINYRHSWSDKLPPRQCCRTHRRQRLIIAARMPLTLLIAPFGQPGTLRCRALGVAADAFHGLVSAPHRVGNEAEVNDRGEVTVALRNLCGRRRVPHHRDLEALFEKFA